MVEYQRVFGHVGFFCFRLGVLRSTGNDGMSRLIQTLRLIEEDILTTTISVSKRFNHVGAGQEVSQRISTARRIATVIFLIVPFLGLVAAIVFLWGGGFHWVELGLLLGMYVLTT